MKQPVCSAPSGHESFRLKAIPSRTRWGETVESGGAVMKRPRVLLADDHPGVAKALGDILSSEFDLVGVVGDGLSLLDSVARLEPDVIVADISMPKIGRA